MLLCICLYAALILLFISSKEELVLDVYSIIICGPKNIVHKPTATVLSLLIDFFMNMKNTNVRKISASICHQKLIERH